MKKITDFIVKNRIFIIILFGFFVIFSAILSRHVNINYDMTEYLPKTSETRIGMNIMEEEFDEISSSYLNVMFKGLNDEEKDKLYDELASIDGVASVDYDDTEDYNKDEYTLFVVNVDDADDSETARNLYNYVNDNLTGYEVYMGGDIEQRNKTILPSWIIVLAVCICALILIIMCESYVEPFLFLLCIGMAVILNNGTNIIFGTVSNITNSISAILILALSMDYSIMLINRYRQEKEEIEDNVEAMKEALYKSFLSISSSSLTTIVGLITLVFMSFTIGRDLGFVLAKGVLLSLLVIFTCLPALILLFDKVIVKTKKKTPNIKLNKLGEFIYKTRIIGFILLIVIFVGSYLIKGNLDITYTASEEDKVAAVFPKNNQLAIIYNNKDEQKVANYLDKIENNQKVDEVLAYGNTLNEKLKYDEFNDKLSALGNDAVIDDYLLKILYYNYYSGMDEQKMTFANFVNFVEKDVLTNDNFKDKLDSSTKDNVKTLKKFTSTAEMNKKRSYKEIASILNIKESDVYNLLVFYNKDKVNVTMTLNEFVNFINKDVLTNKEYASSISTDAKKSLKDLSKFLNKKTISKNMTAQEMAQLMGIDENLISQLYLYYYSINGVDIKMSLNEFANFVLNVVANSNEYKDVIDSDTKKSLVLLQIMSNDSIINSPMNSQALSQMFGIDEATVMQILYLQGLSEETPFDFISFILSNEQISASLGDNISQIKQVYRIMVSTKQKATYTYSELSSIVGINSDTVKSIYSLYASSNSELKMTPTKFVSFILQHKDDDLLKGKLNSKTLNNLNLVNTAMNSTLNNKKYTASGIANLLGLKKDDVQLLYSLYKAKNSSSKMSISLKEFVNFILDDVITNPKYSSKFNKDRVSKLKTVKGIMKSVTNKTTYTPGEIFAIISNLTDSIDDKEIELLYLYYGSENNYHDEWRVSVEELINYAYNDILEDKRFNDFIDDEMREDLKNAVTKIEDNKKLIVGSNYSRVVINTKYDIESPEVYDFIQDIYDNLDGTESYIIGDSPMSYEMSKSFSKEFDYISILTMIAIFVVVALSFKSLTAPLILVLIIQCAVYTIMGILSLLGENVYFIALLVVQSILMGATIDYAIVYTSYYIESREKLSVKESVKNAYNNSINTILTSASILIIATFLVGKFASGIVSMLCKTLAEGVLCSTLLILFILPATLSFFDKFIVKKHKVKE